MGFNKRVNTFKELGQVIEDFPKRIIEAIDVSIDQAGQEGTSFLKDFLKRNANWKGTLVSSIKYNQGTKLNSKILVTAPHSRFINEGVVPHRLTRFNPDGSPRLSASGGEVGDWMDEHGFAGVNVIWVGRNLNSPLRKPGLQFIPKTAIHISKLLPRLLEININKKLEVI